MDYQIIAVSRKKRFDFENKVPVTLGQAIIIWEGIIRKSKVLTFLGILDLFFWPGKLRHLTYGSEVYINKIKT